MYRIPLALALIGAEAVLRILPLERAARWLQALHRLPLLRYVGKWGDGRLDQMTEAVDRMDSHLCFSKPSCLRRALALKILFGDKAPLVIGVRRSKNGTLEAHAWTGVPQQTAEEADFETLAVF